MILNNKKAFITTLPSLIEEHCSSFCWFLSIGILEPLTLLPVNILKTKQFDFNLFYKKFIFTYPVENNSNIIKYQKSSIIKLYIPSTFFLFKKKKFFYKFLYLGEIPLMTNNGTFILNGYERIIIYNLSKKPGIYFSQEINPILETSYLATIIPRRGAWLELELKNNQNLTISINKGEKLNIFNFFNIFYLSKKDLIYLSTYPKIINTFFSLKKIDTQKALKNTFKEEILHNKNYYLGINIIQNKQNNKYTNNYKKQKLTIHDICYIIDKLIILNYNKKKITDLDHLQNKYLQSIGEILKIQFYCAINNLQREIVETFDYLNCEKLDLKNLINAKSLISIFQIFFNTSQLVQFLDQTNLLTDLIHRRRIINGTIGDSISSVSLKLRDIHPSHFGRICTIETPEGASTGLILALSLYARINENGDIETPFFIVKNGFVLIKYPAIYLTAKEEENYKIAPADIFINSKGKIIQKFITIRYKQKFIISFNQKIELVSVSPQQILSIGASLIPFIEHNDASRAMMGTNMQRQAIPLIYPHKPIIGTGIEIQLASECAIKSYSNGIISDIMHNFITIKTVKKKTFRYFIKKYKRSNNDTCLTQSIIVWKGELILFGQIIADSTSTETGELALGQNLLIAYMSWNGYNFEDSILINECLIYKDLLTSIKITQNVIEITNLEILTDKVTIKDNKNLDKNGIIAKGIFIKPGDLLLGKITLSKKLLSNNKNFLNQLTFIQSEIKNNSSIFASSTCYGRILETILCSHENNFDLDKNIHFKLIIFIAQIRKIKVGDKLAGRHGNKGIISKILSTQDMPYLPNGKTIDLILNPLGVPSRMNIGQLYEGLLGFAGVNLERRFKILPFDEGFGKNASRFIILHYLQKSKFYQKQLWIFNKNIPGKIIIRDGRTGNCFDNAIIICISYIIKLIHQIEDKLHMRSTGPYSVLFQQPLHGKDQKGGQRFGEMEIWALEAFGAAYTLQEMLTLKSDDKNSRSFLLKAILNHKSISKIELPVSLSVLLCELKALGLQLTSIIEK